MADLDPGYRRELAAQVRDRAPEWPDHPGADSLGAYEQLVDALLVLGWAKPPKTMPVIAPPARSLPRVEGD